LPLLATETNNRVRRGVRGSRGPDYENLDPVLREALAREFKQVGVGLSDALAEIKVCLFVLDREGKVTWLNAAGIEFLGDRRGDLHTALVPPEAQARGREEFARNVVGSTRATSYQTVVLAHDGRRWSAEIDSVRLEKNGEVMGVFGIAAILEPLDDDAAPIDPSRLTPRQLEVLGLLAAGLSTQTIATRLSLSPQTVRNHIRNLLRTLESHSRLQAVVHARELGILP
jgi:DNA-binding CsgD family transcriptional regulator